LYNAKKNLEKFRGAAACVEYELKTLMKNFPEGKKGTDSSGFINVLQLKALGILFNPEALRV
jgi:hypothetical protein